MMKPIKIVYYYEDIDRENGGKKMHRGEDSGYLIASGIAVTQCQNTLYFIRVKPSEEGANLYADDGMLCDIDVMNSDPCDITALPVESALAFAMWAAGKNVANLSATSAAPIAV